LFQVGFAGSLAEAHHYLGLPIPIEVRPYVCATLAAGRAGESILDIRQPNIVGPLIGTDCDGTAAAIVGAYGRALRRKAAR
jgi:hypothetical protein